DSRRRTQVERPLDEVDEVATKIAERPGAIVPELAPLERMHAFAIGPLRRGTEPKVPIEARGRRRASRELASAVSRGNPDMAFGHLADRARFDELDDAAIIVAGVNLRPHLRDELLLLGQL